MKNTPMLAQDIHKNFPFVFKNDHCQRVILETDRRNGEATYARLLNVTTGYIDYAKFWFKGKEACYSFIQNSFMQS